MKSIINLIVNQFTFFPHNKIRLPYSEWPSYASEIWLKTVDNENLQSIYFEHPNGKTEDLIIYFHGNTGNIFSHHRFDDANQFYKLGANVLLISYRGFSKSTGTPSEAGVYIDGETALNYANETLNYANKNIFIFGRSLGTTVATHIAQNRIFKGILLITPLTNARDMAKFMGYGYVSFLVKHALNSTKKIKKIKSKLLIIIGTIDKVTPPEMGIKLFKKHKGQKQLITIENGGHNNLQMVENQKFWDGINTFVNK
jgi:fermentation-respiration switch protein FrsA (DUF1100 family)